MRTKLFESLEERNYSEDLVVDGHIILKRMLGKRGLRVCSSGSV
jgi:hypothetical protein